MLTLNLDPPRQRGRPLSPRVQRPGSLASSASGCTSELIGHTTFHRSAPQPEFKAPPSPYFGPFPVNDDRGILHLRDTSTVKNDIAAVQESRSPARLSAKLVLNL
eukprot:2907310-Pleurochrysis_carterae.AAC.2